VGVCGKGVHARRSAASLVRVCSPAGPFLGQLLVEQNNFLFRQASWAFGSRSCLLCRRTLLRSSEISSLSTRRCLHTSPKTDTTSCNPGWKISWGCCGVTVPSRRPFPGDFGRTFVAVSIPHTRANHSKITNNNFNRVRCSRQQFPRSHS
jgi:hypothetical protein